MMYYKNTFCFRIGTSDRFGLFVNGGKIYYVVGIGGHPELQDSINRLFFFFFFHLHRYYYYHFVDVFK